MQFVRPQFDMTSQEDIDRRVEKKRSSGIDDAIKAYREMNREGKQDARTKRAQAMQELELTSKLRNQGFDVTPDQVKAILEGPKEVEKPSVFRRATDTLGITERQAQEQPQQPSMTDLFGQRTPEYLAKAKRQNESDKLRQLQIDAAQRQAEESTKPYEETREYEKMQARQAAKPISESKSKAATFAERVAQSEEAFGKLGESGYSRGDISSGLESSLPTFMQSAESQMQEQAERNFVNAVLRRESGAAIAPSEFDSAEKQYFPRAGDSPEVIAQKARNRQAVMAGLQAEAGPQAMAKIQGAMPEAPQVEAPQSGGFFDGSKAYAAPMSTKPIENMSREEKIKELMGQ